MYIQDTLLWNIFSMDEDYVSVVYIVDVDIPQRVGNCET